MSRYPRFLATPIPRCPAHCSFARRRHIYVSTTRRSGFPCTHTLRSNSGLPTTRCDSCMRTASRSYSRGVRSRGTPPNSILNRFSFTESADSMFNLTGHVQAGWLAANSFDICALPSSASVQGQAEEDSGDIYLLSRFLRCVINSRTRWHRHWRTHCRSSGGDSRGDRRSEIRVARCLVLADVESTNLILV